MMGGAKKNGLGQVLDLNDQPIPRLGARRGSPPVGAPDPCRHAGPASQTGAHSGPFCPASTAVGARPGAPKFVFGAKAVKLVHNDENTEVTGVIAELADGSLLEVDAQAVVLAAGDFGAGTEMYNALCAEAYALGEYKNCGAMMGYNGIMNGVSIGMALTLGMTLGEHLATEVVA